MIAVVVGARPNFVKVAPFWHAWRGEKCLIHTGQHYDNAMSRAFFRELNLPPARYQLGVGSGSHAEQVAKVLKGITPILQSLAPEAVLVAGDVNSTLGAGLAAAQLNIPLVHLEAGLRSDDWSMPEELNRCVVDRIADLCLCPTEQARSNLIQEGKNASACKFVGNTMIDSLRNSMPERPRLVTKRYDVEPQRYILATFHRPALVEDYALVDILELLKEQELPILLPAHPRLNIQYLADEKLTVWPPLPYADFLALEKEAACVVTDSGGVQEETTVLGVPCFTVRPNTERPITVSQGTNRLISNTRTLRRVLKRIPMHRPVSIDLWDGRAGVRAAHAVGTWLGTHPNSRQQPAQGPRYGEQWGKPAVPTGPAPASR